MYRSRYIWTMAIKGKPLERVDQAAAEVLAEAMKDRGLTYRDIRDATGMSLNRIGIILRQEPPPATIGEVDAIAQEVGLSVSKVISEAEARLSATAEVVEFPIKTDRLAAMKHKKYGPKQQMEGEID